MAHGGGRGEERRRGGDVVTPHRHCIDVGGIETTETTRACRVRVRQGGWLYGMRARGRSCSEAKGDGVGGGVGGEYERVGALTELTTVDAAVTTAVLTSQWTGVSCITAFFFPQKMLSFS